MRGRALAEVIDIAARFLARGAGLGNGADLVVLVVCLALFALVMWALNKF